MSALKHTPGPWKFSFESADSEWAIVTTIGGSVISNVNADHRQEANARLIAAAPMLLEALRPLAAMGDASIRATILAALRPHERESFVAATGAARAAIAAATGDE